MKALKNVKMKWKLFALCIPLVIAIIISVVMTGIRVNNTRREVTAVYYDMLYTVNSNLLSADRDLYQTLNNATFYYDFHGVGSLYAGMVDQALTDYHESKQRILDSVAEAARIASTDELSIPASPAKQVKISGKPTKHLANPSKDGTSSMTSKPTSAHGSITRPPSPQPENTSTTCSR